MRNLKNITKLKIVLYDKSVLFTVKKQRNNRYHYLDKQHDTTSHLYNYGYRDYNPQTARFTTIDPIRDGHNWFSYCNADPVNFIDLWGLEIMKFGDYSFMSDFDDNINGTDSKISDNGCAMTGVANILTEIQHKNNPKQIPYDEGMHSGTLKNITPKDLNVKENFYKDTDNLDWEKTVSKYGLTAKRSKNEDDAKRMIKKAKESKNQEYLLIQVPIVINDGDKKKTVLHWVGHTGKTVIDRDGTWIEISPTSRNDFNRAINNSNWKNMNGKIYIKQTDIKGAVVIQKKNK